MQANLPPEDQNPWVVAGMLPGTHLTDLQRPWRRIRERADLKDVRLKGSALDENLTMTGKLLGHTLV